MEKSFIILPDASCDLSAELREKYGIDFIPGTFTYPDGTEEEAFLDWKDCKHVPGCDGPAFYAALKKKPNEYVTAPAPTQQFYNVFERYVNEGKGVLSLSLSSGISGSYGFSVAAKHEIEEKYPGAEIYCIDTRRYSGAVGLLAIIAAKLRDEGKSIKETAEYIENNKIRCHQAGWLDDLSFVAKKGRISNAKAFFGTLVGIKPIGELDANGLTTVIAKVKGEKLAYKALIRYMEELGEDLSDQTIIIAQSDRLKQAQEYKRLIEEKFSPREVFISEVYPYDGINIGPGLMAAFFMGKPISDGLAAEREVINRAIAAVK